VSESERLPIFPLSNVVLFPRVKTPLHLFEPRYRQLARDVLQGERRIGMVVVRPEHVDEMPGDPPIYPIGCAGVITESQRLPDGRYNLVLLGEHRVRIVGEEPRGESQLYRVAQVVRLPEPYPRPSGHAWRGCAPRSSPTSASSFATRSPTARTRSTPSCSPESTTRPSSTPSRMRSRFPPRRSRR
jgi:hypothetical protein